MKGERLQRVRGLIAGILVGIPLWVFLVLSPALHAQAEVAIAICVLVGVAVFAVVGTRSDAHDEAADAAWREAALDLPPASDRVILERMQASMPGPGKPRKSGPMSGEQKGGAQPSGAAVKGAEPK
jgi:hypothetical protein